MLGRSETRKRNPFRIVAQLWASRRAPESGLYSAKGKDLRFGIESDASGRSRFILQDIDRILAQHETEGMRAGEIFGEIAALTRQPRTRTIFANSEEVELLEIRWQGLRELKKSDPGLDTRINEQYRKFGLRTYFDKAPLFRDLPGPVREQLREKTEFITYGRYDWTGDYKRMVQQGKIAPGASEVVMAQEGDYPNGVVIIRAGFARLSKKQGAGQRTLSYIGDSYACHPYGLREIAHNWRKHGPTVPLQHTLGAVGYTHALIIPTAVMEALVLPDPSVQRKLPALFSEGELNPAANSPFGGGARIDEQMLEFLGEHRFYNGTKTMVIDLDRCTRCDDCVRACASTHDNNPRFLRHGPTQGNIMVANACLHCEDPVCLIGCPTGAIHREAAGGEVAINPVTCIGCEVCANNCPYDAIRMVEARDSRGAVLVDGESKPIMKATKCDLCVEQHAGPACQRACPHDALIRMNVNDFDKFANWARRR